MATEWRNIWGVTRVWASLRSPWRQDQAAAHRGGGRGVAAGVDQESGGGGGQVAGGAVVRVGGIRSERRASRDLSD
jgi:hypothetical protein